MVSLEKDPKDLLNDWPFWREKVLYLAKIESATRPYLKKTLASLDKSFDNNEGILQLIISYCYLKTCYAYV